MSRILIFRLRRRRAVSTMIGGVIILSLLLTALGTIVFVTQQYDQYQQTASNMAQYRNQEMSEDLVAVSPGLAIVNSTISGWSTSQSTCGTKTGTTEFNCYDMSLTNLGGVGVQIMRIYINSTGPVGSGCSYSPSAVPPNPQPCVLNPSITIAPYTFDQANQFVNTGERNYTVALALPTGVALPTPALTSLPPQNSIVIVTGRGNVFSFQWPLQNLPFLPTSAFSEGNMKVAYQSSTTTSTCTSTTGCDSSHDYYGAPGNTFPNEPYCHDESLQSYPAAAGYAEELTGITGVTGNTLYFVNPWVTAGNSGAVITSGGDLNAYTTLYIYVVIVNTGSAPYIPTAGSVDLTWYGSNHIDGYLFGVYYDNAFYATAPSIPPGAYYYAIYKITYFSIGDQPWENGIQPESPSVMMWGSASIANALKNGVEQSEDQSFFSGTILVSGLWLRYEGTTSGGKC